MVSYSIDQPSSAAMASEAVGGPKGSRSAAAEARRQRILQRGADRLNSITIGGKNSPLGEKPGAWEDARKIDVSDLLPDRSLCLPFKSYDTKLSKPDFGCAEVIEAVGASTGSRIAESGPLQQQDQAPKEQVPASVPHEQGSKNDADHADTGNCREPDAASAQGDADVDRRIAQPRPTVAAKARADRWAQYEEPASSGAAATAQPIHTQSESVNFLQVKGGFHLHHIACKCI